MFERLLLSITAFSSTVTAIFCVWIALNMFACDREMDKALGGPPSFSSPAVSTEADLARERAEIERQLNRKK